LRLVAGEEFCGVNDEAQGLDADRQEDAFAQGEGRDGLVGATVLVARRWGQGEVGLHRDLPSWNSAPAEATTR
jgi:hypothetical protein